MKRSKNQVCLGVRHFSLDNAIFASKLLLQRQAFTV